MIYLPVSLAVKNRLCLVIGAGLVARRKVQTLLQAGARVRVISPEICPPLRRLARNKKIEWTPRRWKPSDLGPAWLVIAATADGETNRRIQRAAEQRRLWVNAVDDPGHCSMIFPSFFNRRGLQIAVSTSGHSPALARKIREALDAEWHPQSGLCLLWLSTFRGQVKTQISDLQLRLAFWDQALNPKTLRLIQQGRLSELKRSLPRALRRFQERNPCPKNRP